LLTIAAKTKPLLSTLMYLYYLNSRLHREWENESSKCWGRAEGASGWQQGRLHIFL
jgi:hypothetical protein